MENNPNNKRARDIGFYALILVVLLATVFTLTGGSRLTLTYSQVIDLFEAKQVESFSIKGSRLTMSLREPYEGQTEITKSLRSVDQFNTWGRPSASRRRPVS